MKGHSVIVKGHDLKKQLKYKEKPVLIYTIKYPQFSLSRYQYFTNRLSRYYQDKAFEIVQFCENVFYKGAADGFDMSERVGSIFHEYEFQSDYAVTENCGCCLSIYFDDYKYEGGANGVTHRRADNWDMLKDRRMTLAELFPGEKDYTAVIIAEINRQIDDRREDEGFYFPDHKKLVKEYFDQKNFYLTPDGVVVFFQEVTIAPHSSGIVIFKLPYVRGPLRPASYEY